MITITDLLQITNNRRRQRDHLGHFQPVILFALHRLGECANDEGARSRGAERGDETQIIFAWRHIAIDRHLDLQTVSDSTIALVSTCRIGRWSWFSPCRLRVDQNLSANPRLVEDDRRRPA